MVRRLTVIIYIYINTSIFKIGLLIIYIIGLHLPQNYYHSIPAAPELGQSRKVDISRLRDIRKRLDTGHISTKELEIIAVECIDELVELCSGNSYVKRYSKSSF